MDHLFSTLKHEWMPKKLTELSRFQFLKNHFRVALHYTRFQMIYDLNSKYKKVYASKQTNEFFEAANSSKTSEKWEVRRNSNAKYH